MTPEEKHAESVVVMKAASDRDIARHEREQATFRADTLEVENMALKATLRRVCAWLYDEKLYRKLPTAIEEEILVALGMSAEQVTE